MRQRHIVLALLVLLSILTFLDRLCIAVAGARMQAELGITSEQWGWVLGAFVLSYGLFEIPTGVMGDRSGQRRVLVRIVLWWSAFTALTGAAPDLWTLAATRFLFGMGEAGAYPNMSGVVSRWFPAQERARAQGFIWAASRAGGALAPLLVVPIQQRLGWRAAFWILGALGVFWCGAWWRFYRDDPRRHPGVGSREMEEIGPIQPPGDHRIEWSVLARSPQIWVIIAMYGCYAWGSWFYFSWLHTYLIRARGFTENEMAVASSMPFLLGIAANIGGGFLSDFAVKRLGLQRGRKIVGGVCLSLAACLLLALALTSGKLAAIILLAAGFGVMDLMLPSAWAICLDIGRPHAGAVSGAMNTAGQLGGFLCTVVFGYLVAHFQNYNAPLYVIASMLLVSAALFLRIDASRPLFGRQTALEKSN